MRPYLPVADTVPINTLSILPLFSNITVTILTFVHMLTRRLGELKSLEIILSLGRKQQMGKCSSLSSIRKSILGVILNNSQGLLIADFLYSMNYSICSITSPFWAQPPHQNICPQVIISSSAFKGSKI